MPSGTPRIESLRSCVPLKKTKAAKNMEIGNSELGKEIEKRERLGSCEICGKNQAKYTCPKCSAHTCSLNCIKSHKKTKDCDGTRDKTMYIPLKRMTPLDFMNDYYFLEEATRFTKKIQENDKRSHFQRKNLPLKQGAMRRNIKLFFINSELSKRKKNYSSYNKVKDEIYWHVHLVFPNADFKMSKKFHENTKVLDIIKKIIDAQDGNKQLDFYRAQGTSKLRVLLKAEGVKKSHIRHYELDISKSLKACLTNKVIIEYPTLYVVINHHMDEFELIDSDDESVQDEQHQFLKLLHEEVFSKKVGQNPMLLVRPEEIPLMSKIIEDEMQKTNKNKPQNSPHQPQKPQQVQRKTVDDNSDSDNEIAPENYFFS